MVWEWLGDGEEDFFTVGVGIVLILAIGKKLRDDRVQAAGARGIVHEEAVIFGEVRMEGDAEKPHLAAGADSFLDI